MQKFLFETSFDSADARRDESPRPAEPKFGQQELEAARQAGWAEGRAAGESQAKESIEEATRLAIGQVEGALGGMSDQLVYVAEQARRDALSVAMTALRTLFPRLAAEHGLREIETVMAECLELARHEPAIVFKFHPDVQEAASPQLEAMTAARAFPGKLVILADQTLARDGCAVEWADGGAERNSEAVLQQIEDVVAQALGDHAPDDNPTPSEANKPDAAHDTGADHSHEQETRS